MAHDLPRRVAHHEEAFTDAHHTNRAVLEERIVVPRPRKARRVLPRLRIEVPDLLRILRIADVENAEPRLVVRLINAITLHVHVVIARLRRADVLLHHHRLLEIRHVEDHRARALDRLADAARLIELVVEIPVLVIVGEPALVRVAWRWVVRVRDDLHIFLIGHVLNRDGRLVGCHADLVVFVPRIRTFVHHALDVVRVAAALPPGADVREAAREFWFEWRSHVDHQ
jgi:hypothetical protein